jgi:hypothetical protein
MIIFMALSRWSHAIEESTETKSKCRPPHNPVPVLDRQALLLYYVENLHAPRILKVFSHDLPFIVQ